MHSLNSIVPERKENAPLACFKSHTGSPPIDRFLEHCKQLSYPAKNIVIHEGDTSNVLYYIIKGSVSVLRENEKGHELVLAYLNQGDFFGEMGLFNDTPDRSAWVRTKTKCILAEISYDKFRALAETDSSILFELSSQMATRLRNTSRKVSDLTFFDVTGRIARTLLDLCQQPDALSHPDGMQISVTRQEIGKLVGCYREMAGRVIKELESQHLITAKG